MDVASYAGGLSVVVSMAHRVIAHTFSSATFSMHYRRSVALLVVCGACRLDIDYPPSLPTGRQDRPGIAQVRVATKRKWVDADNLAAYPQSLMVSLQQALAVPPPNFLSSPPSLPQGTCVCPSAINPSSPLTTRTSARILRLRGEAKSFASGGEPAQMHLYGTSAGLPCGFQPTAMHLSLRGELPRRRACMSAADTEKMPECPVILFVWYRARA